MKFSIAWALGLVAASCAPAPRNIGYPTAHVDAFAALRNIESGKEVTLSGYLFNGPETSGIYRFPDTHKSGEQCVRMSFDGMKGLKSEDKKITVRGVLRRSDSTDLIFHACQVYFFEDFTVFDR